MGKLELGGIGEEEWKGVAFVVYKEAVTQRVLRVLCRQAYKVKLIDSRVAG
jgi:hypothetical protein